MIQDKLIGLLKEFNRAPGALDLTELYGAELSSLESDFNERLAILKRNTDKLDSVSSEVEMYAGGKNIAMRIYSEEGNEPFLVTFFIEEDGLACRFIPAFIPAEVLEVLFIPPFLDITDEDSLVLIMREHYK